VFPEPEAEIVDVSLSLEKIPLPAKLDRHINRFPARQEQMGAAIQALQASAEKRRLSIPVSGAKVLWPLLSLLSKQMFWKKIKDAPKSQ